MAPTLVATLGGSTSNSYVDLTFADAYAENVQWGATWLALTEDARKLALITSTTWLETLEWPGKRCTPATDDEDLAQRLESAVIEAQDGAPPSQVSGLYDEIKKANDDYLMSTGDMSVGVNELQSAARLARDAAREGDLADLAKARREIALALNTIAAEAGP